MKIMLIGAFGRLGSRISALAEKDSEIEIVAKIGRGHSIDDFLPMVDIVLDISTPEALEGHLPKIVKAKKPLVIGSTGHTEAQRAKIQEAAQHIPLIHSHNFSHGIALLKSLLPWLPEDARYEIIERHHTKKKDTPSGTSLDLAPLLPNPPRIHSIREGDIVGEHTIVIHLPFEKIEIRHEVLTRDVFALGAINTCKKLWKKDYSLV